MRRYGVDIKKQVFRLREKGLTIKEISKELGVGNYTVWAWLNNFHKTSRNYKGKKLQSLFELVKTKTLNFERILPELFMENSHYLIVLRYMFGLTERELCKKLRMTRSKLISYLNTQTLKKENPFHKEFCIKLSNLFNKLVRQHPEVKFYTAEDVERKRKEIFARLKPPRNFIDYHKLAESIPLNDSELKIAKILKKNKIPYQAHKFLKAFSREINVDFIIPNKENPQVIIEVAKAFAERPIRKNNIERKIRELDHKFYDIKRTNPNVKCILICFTNKKINEKIIFFADKFFISEQVNKEILAYFKNLARTWKR